VRIFVFLVKHFIRALSRQYQFGWITELSTGLEKLDSNETKLFINDTSSDLNKRIHKKGG